MSSHIVLNVLVVAVFFTLTVDAVHVKINFEAQCEKFGEFFNTAAGHCEYCSIMCHDPRSQTCVYYCSKYAEVQIAKLEAKASEKDATANNEPRQPREMNPMQIGGFIGGSLVFVVILIVVGKKFVNTGQGQTGSPPDGDANNEVRLEDVKKRSGGGSWGLSPTCGTGTSQHIEKRNHSFLLPMRLKAKPSLLNKPMTLLPCML